MRKGTENQVRRTVRGLFVTLSLVMLAAGTVACHAHKKKATKNKAKTANTGQVKKSRDVTNKKVAKHTSHKPKKATGPKADFKPWVDRLTQCDKTYFSHIDPNSIDNWQPPIPLGSMQSQCDSLAVDIESLGKKYAFYGPAVDDLLFSGYRLIDEYRMFLARSKSMSVRKKLPWKKEVAGLKKRLREISLEIRKKYQAMDWGQVKPVSLDHKYMSFLSKNYLKHALKWALRNGFGQAKKKKVVYLYTLKFESLLLDGMSKELAGTKTARPIQAFAGAYRDVVQFFSGNYFDHLRDTGRKLKGSLVKAGIRFRRVLR